MQPHAPIVVDPRVERSRAAVLDAAVEVLIGRGLEGFTVGLVSKQSGVAKTTIYRIWPDRAALLIDALTVMLPPVAEAPPSGPLVQRVAAVLFASAAKLASREHQNALPILLDVSWRDPAFTELRDKFVNAEVGPMRRLLADAWFPGHRPTDARLDRAIERLYGPLLYRTVVQHKPVDSGWCVDLAESILAVDENTTT